MAECSSSSNEESKPKKTALITGITGQVSVALPCIIIVLE